MANSNKKGLTVLRQVLRISEPRPAPTDSPQLKNKYAIRFADEMATLLARDLTPSLKGIEATTKRQATSARGKKQLDVNFSTPQLGLAVGISLKSVHIREAGGAERYTHNMKRNEEELRIEATGYHKRQPYAVMIGLLWLPFDSCTDGKNNNSSSFGSWVRHLRPYAGRRTPKDDEDRFERIYIGLYEPDASKLGFFDIETDPPKNDRPRHLLGYEQLLEAIHGEYLIRNHAAFRWAGGDEEPLSADEIAPAADDDEQS